VERALAADCEVLWISDERMNPAFVSSLRNDALAQGPLNRHRRHHNSVVTQLVFPAPPRLRFAEGYAIDTIVPHARGVEIRLRPKVRAKQRYVDQAHNDLRPLHSAIGEQAVIAIGQETNHAVLCPGGCGRRRETNAWATMLDGLLRPAFLAYRHFILDPGDNMSLGLQTLDSRLRVLGTAFLAHPYTQKTLKQQRSALFRYLVSLCEQAQVDRGAAMASFTTAKANDWFARRGNRDRNSATR
jgi:hypothetical protein